MVMKTRSKGERATANPKENPGLALTTTTKKQQHSKPKPKAKGSVDPKKPKKPPTAFFYFMEDFRKTYQTENPSVKSMRDIGKACGEKWKTMNFEEKVQYYDIATEKRAEYEKAVATYLKKKESGELSEEEIDDDEFE